MATHRRANLKELALHLGLSVTTVSRALKDGPEVRPETIARVKVAAEALGYVPNLHGRALRMGRTQALAAILPMETRDHVSDIAKLPLIEGMTLAASEQGFSLTIMSTTPDEDPHDNLSKVLQSGNADGVIITRMVTDDARIPLLVQRRIPFITFGRSEPVPRHAFVDIDNEKIAHEATGILLDRGHRRIALQLLTPEDRYSAARLDGYVRALKERDLPIQHELVGHHDFTMEASERWIDRLLGLPDPPRAFICANELGLFGALSALRRHELVIGRDVEIAVRDSTSIARYLSLPLIVHSVDMAAVGARLVEGLVRQITKPRDPLLQAVFLAELQR